MDRATVARYADMDDMTPKPPMDRRRGSKIDPYAALVDEWLEADRMLPRRQRHTARRVHDRLRAETGYDGEYTTTPGYVRRWREANRSGSDGYGELVWAPGVAQIDFGVAKARIAGELVDDHCLVVTFPRSNMRYVCISSSRCFVFSHVFFSGWGWCRFVGLVVDSITTNHATRPSSRRRSMMLMPNSVLIRLSRYQTM